MNGFWTWPLSGAAFLGAFLTLAVAARTGDGHVRGWLALVLMTTTAFVVEFLLMLSQVYSFPVMFITYPLFFLLGPAFWALCRALAGTPTAVSKFAPHLLPAVLFAVDFSPYYRALLVQGIEGTGGANLSGLGGYGQMILQLGHTAIYVGWGLRYLAAYERTIRTRESGVMVARATWIRRVAIAFVALIVIEVLAACTMMFARYHVVAAEFAMAFAFAGVVLAMGWMILHQPEIFARPESPRPKYEKSSLEVDRLEQHAERLVDFFQTHRPWLDPDLSLAVLAREMKVPPHHLSQVFRRAFDTNFFDFVNGHRVRDAARQLVREGVGGKTILAVAFDSGFSSKASFNRVFKGRTGMTPSQFRSEGTEDHPVLRSLVPEDFRAKEPHPHG